MLKVGNPQATNQSIIQKTIQGIHPDHLKIIDNIIRDSRDGNAALAMLTQMELTEDFGFNHWQYIGAKLGYRTNWSKGAFYKYTVRKRMKIRSDVPERELVKIYAICDTLPETQTVIPQNWTSELESAEKYLQFALAHRQKYYLVPLTRNAQGEWVIVETEEAISHPPRSTSIIPNFL